MLNSYPPPSSYLVFMMTNYKLTILYCIGSGSKGWPINLVIDFGKVGMIGKIYFNRSNNYFMINIW